MKVFVLDLCGKISPFNDPARDSLILGRKLFESQEEVFIELGFELVNSPPQSEDYLLVSSRTWFTAQTILQFL